MFEEGQHQCKFSCLCVSSYNTLPVQQGLCLNLSFLTLRYCPAYYKMIFRLSSSNQYTIIHTLGSDIPRTPYPTHKNTYITHNQHSFAHMGTAMVLKLNAIIWLNTPSYRLYTWFAYPYIPSSTFPSPHPPATTPSLSAHDSNPCTQHWTSLTKYICCTVWSD